MSLGEAWWFVDKSDGPTPLQILEYLHSCGVSSRHITNSQVWVLDDVGSRRESSLEFVANEWAAGRALTMQLWLDDNTDVILTLEPERSLFTFSLDGLLIDEAVKLVAYLLLGAGAKFNTLFLVVDRQLPDSGANWLMMAADCDPLYTPDLLLSRTPSGSQTLTIKRESWLTA